MSVPIRSTSICAGAARTPWRTAIRPRRNSGRGVGIIGKGLAIAALVVLFDQLVKWLVLLVVMQPPRVIPVLPFFNLVLTWNQGVSFGMFGDGTVGPWLLAGLAAVIVVVLLVWLRRADSDWSVAALGMVIGGALGNVIDRLYHGAVVDFLDVHAGGWHWPAFNIADAAITVGVIMLLAESLFPSRHPFK